MSNYDGDWKPNGRPQSTIARNFSASLNDAFAIDSTPHLDGLVQSVEQKKQAVSSQSQELEALEARLRETEERLKQRQSRTSSPAGTAGNGANSPQRRKPLGTTFSGQENDRLQTSTTSPLATTQNAGSQSLSPSTMSRWGPTVKDDRSEAENTGNMPVGRSSGLQDSGYSE